MKRIALFFVAMVSISATLKAQDGSNYKSAIGGRLGTTYYDVLSFSYKNFISKQGALEFNAGFGAKKYDHSDGHYNATTLSFALTYQHHFDIKPVEGLRWFIGGGATIFNTFSDGDEYDGFGFGIYPTGGIDYKFSGIPLNLTADVRPTIHVVGPGYYNSFYSNFGLAVRYTLK